MGKDTTIQAVKLKREGSTVGYELIIPAEDKGIATPEPLRLRTTQCGPWVGKLRNEVTEAAMKDFIELLRSKNIDVTTHAPEIEPCNE